MSKLFYSLFVFTALFARTVDVSPYIGELFTTNHAKIGAHPVLLNFSQQDFDQTFAAFIPGEALEKLAATLEEWFPEFIDSNATGIWQEAGYKFGIFGSKKATHKKQRLIKGINCKMSMEFIDWIRETKEISPEMERLLRHLESIDAESQRVFAKVMERIVDLSYSHKGTKRLPVTLRLIRFERSESCALPLHFDISVLSLIFPSNDYRESENLVIAPADGRLFDPLDLRRVLRPTVESDKSCGLIIAGSQMPLLAPHIHPSPHGVLPHNRGARCVIVACLHLPRVDSSKQSALLPKIDRVPDHLLDPFEEIEKASPGALVVLDIGGTLLCNRDGVWGLTDRRWPQTISRAEKVVALTRVPPLEADRIARQQTMLECGLACTILESTTRLKGSRLAEYLLSLEKKPTEIIYVDDKAEQIESVRDVCQQFKIPCRAVHYLR